MSRNKVKKFTRSLNEEEAFLIQEMKTRRKKIDLYLRNSAFHESMFTCSSCGYPTLTETHRYQVCHICWWEDDGQDDDTENEIWGGPNDLLSLTEYRLSACEELHKLKNEIHGELEEDPETIVKIIMEHEKEFDRILEESVGSPKWNLQVEKLKQDLMKRHK